MCSGTTSLRGRLIEVCHDSPLGGHTGDRKLKHEMMSQFFWPQMSSHIEKYVATCEHCQRNKSYNSSTRGIPQPHVIPSRRFDVVSVDLLPGFPTTKNGYDCIVAFTDRLTKRAYISPCRIMGPSLLVHFGNNSFCFWKPMSDSLRPTTLSRMVDRRNSTRL